jgi:deoxyribonuclease-4
MPLGAHTSIAGGVDKAILRGQEIGCETIQIFTTNARQWRARPLSEEESARFQQNREGSGLAPIFAHDSYLINLASPDEALWRRSVEALLDEMARCEALDLPYLVAHPGSHVGAGEEAGLRRIAQALNRIHARAPGSQVRVLLETTAGQGTSLGCRFEHLARLLELVEDDRWLGVCLDTCHVLAAGYELRTPQGYAETFRQLEAIIGLDRLRVIHLNDSEGDLGSRVDRHAHIGQGCLGLEPFRLLLHDARFRDLPMVLETPRGADMDRANLAVLKGLREEG